MRQSLPRRAALAFLSLALLLDLIGCGKESSDIIGQAYVASATLNLRGELNQRSSNVAVLKHGDRVGILDIRRRFVKVRTDKGQEGWLDALQLLSVDQMEQLRRNTQKALETPSMGSATVYEALNVHIDPNRQSPALARIPEAGSVAVLGHRVEPKLSTPPTIPTLIADRPQQPAHRPKKEKQARNANRFVPPYPPPPKVPENWQELSLAKADAAESNAKQAAAKPKQPAGKKEAAELKKPVIMEDWTLIRTKDNQAGWVLSRNLVMSIPDEVAQYAEGKRITSYFDLGAVQDEEKGVKHNWLWTTASGVIPYDFDAWRVFLWNRRRHRYETSYRQRDLEGYFPVEVPPADANSFGRAFKLVTKDDDGKFRRREYLFDGARVHLTGTEEYNPAKPAREVNKSAGLDTNQLQAKAPGWFRRQWNAVVHLFKRP